jgi:uncharacterized protein YbjT (DUF2867 family)
MNKRIALVFGSTGLIGNLLLDELLDSDSYQAVKLFVRQPTEISHPKISEYVSDFSNPASFSEQMMGDDLFICLGTTIRKAGTIKRMEEIDRDLPVMIADTASKNGVKRIAIVSSLGAKHDSHNYYLRIKGEMEREIMKLKFENTAIVRPSILLGERREKRKGEAAGKIIMKIFNPLLHGSLKKYRGIHGRDVAKAMISILHEDMGKNIYESHDLQRIANMSK